MKGKSKGFPFFVSWIMNFNFSAGSLISIIWNSHEIPCLPTSGWIFFLTAISKESIIILEKFRNYVPYLDSFYLKILSSSEYSAIIN